MEATLILKAELINQTHLPSADVVDDVLIFCAVATTVDIV